MTKRNPNIIYLLNCEECGGKLEGRQRRWCSHICEVNNWQRKNVKKVEVWKKTYIQRNPEKRKQSVKKYDNSEKAKKRKEIWVELNRKRLNELARIRSKKYRDRLAAQNSRRRAIIKNLKEHYTGDEWRELKKKWNYTCLCCRKKEPEILLTPDHIIPLIKGGKDTIDNIQPLCRTCNLRKNDKHSTDYRS
jgi:5-methylcytosine-specific restriction endonuclease McrA